MSEEMKDPFSIFENTESLSAGDRRVFSINETELPFRWCPPGEFLMGALEHDKWPAFNEPLHYVRLTHGFWLLETPVTISQWEAIMGNRAPNFTERCKVFFLFCEKKIQKIIPKIAGLTLTLFPEPSLLKRDRIPVTTGFNQAVSFCESLNKTCIERNGWSFSLPTEAQWEYACRAGTVGEFGGKAILIPWAGSLTTAITVFIKSLRKLPTTGGCSTCTEISPNTAAIESNASLVTDRLIPVFLDILPDTLAAATSNPAIGNAEARIELPVIRQ